MWELAAGSGVGCRGWCYGLALKYYARKGSGEGDNGGGGELAITIAAGGGGSSSGSGDDDGGADRHRTSSWFAIDNGSMNEWVEKEGGILS